MNKYMFEKKKIFILGMAKSGYEVAKLLIKRNNDVIINDMNEEQDSSHIKELKDLGVKFVLGGHPDDLFDETYDYLVKNPGIFNNHKYVLKAMEHNIPVINEVEVAYQLFPNNVDIIGITGTNGKTTTTTIIYEFIKRAGKNVHLTGNIGFPVCSFVDIVKPNDILVMEVSIQQLCNVDKFRTNVSVLTNLYEAHLDFVGNYENYTNIKKGIFNYHNEDNYAILNIDNDDVISLTDDIKSTKLYFSSQKVDINGCYIKDGYIYYFNEIIIPISKIKIKGIHNYENIMAAILVAKRYDVSNDVINEVLESFGGVEHRIEFVRTINDIDVYNDSKATNVKATQIALSSFDKPTILLLGGLDRGHSFDDLGAYLKNVKAIVAYGQTKDRIKEFANINKMDCHIVETLEQATIKAYDQAIPGDVILLSPACASWDQFVDFPERGNKFKKYVAELK
jgi:UDP-N-acetylmuramoylalanine--D-glutamate ligase